jgi:hypothetical protein
LLYEINTLTAKSKVLVGWANVHGSQHQYNEINATMLTGDKNYA